MISKCNWKYDEKKHAGVDYNKPDQVRKYDTNHQSFRDYKKESDGIINALGLGSEHTVIDMGSGTGAFALHAARCCKMVYAVDVSKAMLDYSRQKAQKQGLNNIAFCQSGFLSYEHNAEPADAMVCVAALHHLPDFWKLIGLKRALKMLKPNGRFFLFDVVFPSDITDYENSFNEWVQSTRNTVGSDIALEVETHIRDEYSTCDWIMEGLIDRGGFHIDSTQYADRYRATYVCTKKI